ncbi:TRAP transporter small permease [Hwanghaeella grinnelliae]|uniref:TRAP transporter small permease protein n=1 Tax=Hwanghaeella grinnelliae TaxID=2500179 RepID=A0A437QVA9_9PROT|nr:TRAP transporter small permease [Hwanghaeella grinnelliae]RVU38418.1 TRAP transporter small permease [Hwanghaeella grinnelliae]
MADKDDGGGAAGAAGDDGGEQGTVARLSRAVTLVNDFLATVCMNLAGIGLVILTVIFGWLVFGRYVLNSTPTWVEQISLLLVVFIAFLGASAGIQEKTHLNVDVMTMRMPRRIKAFLHAVVYLTLAGFGIFLAVYGFKLVQFKWGSLIPLIGWSEGIRVLPLFFGGVLITLFSLGHLLAMSRSGWDKITGIEPDELGD